MTTSPDYLMPCHEVVQLLWEYLDDELDDARRASIREHLDLCDHCRDHFTFEGAFLRSVERVLDDHGDSAALRTRILQALRDEGYDAP
jgi:mycothiol system anti-sigma-R factor